MHYVTFGALMFFLLAIANRHLACKNHCCFVHSCGNKMWESTLRKSPSGQYSIASRENGLAAICTISSGTANARTMFGWVKVSIISHSLAHWDALLCNWSSPLTGFMLFTAKNSSEFYSNNRTLTVNLQQSARCCTDKTTHLSVQIRQIY